MKRTFLSAVSALLALALVCSAFVGITPVSAKKSDPVLTAEPADEWSALFDRRGKTQTWLGADGIYSVAIDGNDAFASATDSTKTFFIFSDSLMGSADDTGYVYWAPGQPSQTSAVLTGSEPNEDNIRFVWGNGGNGDFGWNTHLFGEHKWMLDCFVVGNAVYIFGFPEQEWKPKQIDMIKIPIVNGEPDYAHYSKTANISDLWYRDGDTALYAYGVGVMPNTESAGAENPDGYIYIYGYRDAINEFSRKDLIVSRIKESDFPDFSKTTYWNGSEWCNDISQSVALVQNVSCEFSVSPVTVGPYAGKYICVYTLGTESAYVNYAIGDSPCGPFDTPVTCYTTPEHGGDNGGIYTYNAKAHPHLSKDGKLLISYNCNNRNTFGGQTSVDYHPRFIWLDLDPELEREYDVSKTVSQLSTDKNSMRFIAAVESLDYSRVGFEFTVTDTATGSVVSKEFSDRLVYSAVTFDGTTVTADDLGVEGGYVFTFIIKNISENFAVTVRAFGCETGGTGVKHYGGSATFTIVNGDYAAPHTNNLALTGTAIADSVSTDYPQNTLEHLNDGNKSTRWQSNARGAGDDPAWCGIAFDEAVTINTVIIEWETAHPSENGFKMQISDNGEAWSDVGFTFERDTSNGDDRQVDTITLSVPTTTRYIRVYCFEAFVNGSGAKEHPSAYEFEVYAD